MNKKGRSKGVRTEEKGKMEEVERDGKAQDNGTLILFPFKDTVTDIGC